MKELKVEIEGETVQDLEIQLTKILDEISSGNLQGYGWDISEVYEEED